MATFSLKTPLGASGNDVWKLIGKFQNFGQWHPAVEKCETTDHPKEGRSVRTLYLTGGAKVVEELTHMDTSERCYRYRILESPLPMKNYEATLKVTETPQGCEVEWSCDFTADNPSADGMKQLNDTIQDIYSGGLDNLRKIFGG